jgi:hypothetical protein
MLTRLTKESFMEPNAFRTAAGLATIAFPLLLLVGFALHPHLFSPRLTKTVDDLVGKFRGKRAFHAGHLLVFLAVPLIILNFCYAREVLEGSGRILGLAGAITGIVGAVLLAGDKGALCIVLSAFDTLPEPEFEAIRPALRTIVERKGLLAIFWALPLLPIGAILQLAGLMKAGVMPAWSGVAGIVGLLLLNNPDLDLVSSAGALCMCFAYIPLGLRMLGVGI